MLFIFNSIFYLQAISTMAYIMPCYSVTPCTQFETIPVIKYVEEQICECGELILPPKSVQLPSGLGFGPSALPAVAEAYDQKFFVNGGSFDFADAYVPVSSPYSCIKLATPISPDISSLVYPIVL